MRYINTVMFQFFKFGRLAGALKSREAGSEAYSAVLELGQIGGPKAVELLIEALSRVDGVSRSAARELGRLGDARAINPLVALLGQSEVSQSVAEALVKLGAIDALVSALKNEVPAVRKGAAIALGEMGDVRAVDPLIEVMQADPEYAVRTAAATALGQIKSPRAIWVLVATLKLRDETTPERQAELEQLRHATTLAMRKIGDPLAGKPASEKATHTAVLEAPAGAETNAVETHPRLVADLSGLGDSELISVLKEVVAASEETSWANLERREPMLPAWFRSYEQRRQAAELIGMELYRRGGAPMLKRILEQDLAGCAAIGNWWNGIG